MLDSVGARHIVSLLIGHIAFFALLSPRPCLAQEAPEPAVVTITPAQQHALIERILSVLEANYVFPDVAHDMAESLRSRLAQAEFTEPARAKTFAETMTSHLYNIAEDRHLWVSVSPGAYPKPAGEPGPDEREARHQALRRKNFGFPRVEILPGNVGYLDIRMFADPELGGDAAAAAMRFLSNTDALILDLRKSMGGSSDMVVLLASYLFGPGPVHLFDMYRRVEDRTEQYWTLRYVPAKRLTEQPVYVLTRSSTFSAGEGLAYTLKHLDRATIVGERTGGAANPGRFHRISEIFVMFVAQARVTSPVTGTNWEGVGVAPDVEVPAELALDVAQKLALETLREAAADPERAEELSRFIEAVEERLEEKRDQVSWSVILALVALAIAGGWLGIRRRGWADAPNLPDARPAPHTSSSAP